MPSGLVCLTHTPTLPPPTRTLNTQAEASVDAATRLADHWKSEAERQATRAARADAAREELRAVHADLAAARSATLDAAADALDARGAAAELQAQLAAALRRAERPAGVDAGVQATLDGGGGGANADVAADGATRSGVAAAWCPEGGAADVGALLLPRAVAPPPLPAAHHAGGLRLPATTAAQHASLPPPPFGAAGDAGFVATQPSHPPSFPGAGVAEYLHPASGLRLVLEARPRPGGSVENALTITSFGAGVPIPTWARAGEEMVTDAGAPDWRMMMSTIVGAVGKWEKANNRG